VGPPYLSRLSAVYQRIDALLGLFILTLIIVVVKDFPIKIKEENNTDNTLSIKNSIVSVLQNKENLLCGIYTSLMNLPVFVFSALWGNSYLMHVNHITQTQASIVTSMIFFGTIIGAPVLGYVSDKLNNHKQIMLIASVICLLIALYIFKLKSESLNLLIFNFFILGFFSSGQCLSYPIMINNNPSYLIGTSILISRYQINY